MSNKKIVLISLICAIVVGAIVLSVSLSKNEVTERTTQTKPFSFTTVAKGEVSNLFNTVIFLGTDFTVGTKSKESFTDQLEQQEIIRPAVFAKKGIKMVDDGKKNNYISLLKSIPTKHAAPAMLMCELSYYDAKKDSRLGKLSDGYNLEDFDTSTVIGAMEYIICYSQETWGCPVTFYTCYYNDSNSYKKMVDALYEVAEKWSIDVIDFYSPMDTRISLQNKKKYLADKLNPTKEGYENIFTPKFKEYFEERLQ
ncbi:MAG: hypothetical protein ACI4IL_07085 [Eubacterium sp.]